MGILKDAIKQMYASECIEVEFLNTKPRVIQTAAQAKYADLRKAEPGYIQGVHRARKEAGK